MALLSEIGGEFWWDDTLYISEKTDGRTDRCRADCCGEKRAVLSGRTALNAIAQDLLMRLGGFHICLPSYCCHTMIQPFLRPGIEIRFYNVSFDKALHFDFSAVEGCDVVYLPEYFGFSDSRMLSQARQCKRRGQILLYDRTQMAFSDTGAMEALADYTFTSYRKWFYTNYTALQSRLLPPMRIDCERTHARYLALRTQAMRFKTAFIESGCMGDKARFLSLYREAEALLEEENSGYAAEAASVDAFQRLNADRLIEKRRQNATHLLLRLKHIQNAPFALLYDALQDGDCPLYLPLVVRPEKRDMLCRALIEQRIYCPRHWPLSEAHPADPAMRTLYAQELSVICDQRYGIEDMERIAGAIDSWCRDNA